MSEERIKTLLERADEVAGKPAFGYVSHAGIRRRVRQRRILRAAVPLAAAAVVVFAVAIGTIWTQGQGPQPGPQRIASLEEQVRQIRAQTDATLRLVQEVLERDRQQRRLASLEAELASIPDPREQINQEVDKTAFVMVYQADRLYRELNQTRSAVEAYEQVIQFFPQNRWADVARERLSEIKERRFNKIDSQGDSKWNPKNVQLPS